MHKAVWWLGLGGVALAHLVACGPEPQVGPPPSASPSVPVQVSTPSPTAQSSPEAPPIGLGIAAPRFEERFAGPNLNPEVWTALLGPGKQSLGPQGMRLYVEGRQTAFPYVYTRQAVVPQQGPWAVEWSFHLGSITSRQFMVLDYLPPEGFDSPTQSPHFIAVGRVNETIRVSGPVLGGVFFSEAMTTDAYHTFRVEGDGKASASIFIDGKAFRAPFKVVFPPLRFWVGSTPPNNTNFQDWGEIRLKHLVAGRLERSIREFQPPEVADVGASQEVPSTASPTALRAF